MRRVVLLATLLVIGTLSLAAAGLQAPAPTGPSAAAREAAKIEKVKDNLYVITGSSPANRDLFSGGNTAVFVTDAGVVVVDTKLAGWGQVLLDRIKTVTPKPVTTIINTHTHGDHTGSNEFFATAESIVHVNTKANMEKMDAFKGDKAKFVPKKTFQDTLTIGSGKDQIDLYHFGRGHTNGDTFIVFRALRTLHAGDMFPWKDAPFIDRNNGGSGEEWPKTLDKLLKSVSGVDTVIGGHLPVATWSDLAQYQRYTSDLFTGAQAAMKEGKSVDDAVASLNLSAKYPGFESARVKNAVQAIYDELKK
jgi:glyoxylase-like metal-dependent hydrolase (beta-lactamase superfamily II)